MQRMLRIALLLVAISSALIAPLHAAQPQRATASDSRPSTVQVSFTNEQPTLIERVHPEGTFTTFAADIELTGDPGHPALPLLTKVIGVPSGAAPTVQTTLASPLNLPTLEHPLEPVPSEYPADDTLTSSESALQASGAEWVTEYTPDAELYARSEWYPANPVTVSEVSWMRSQAIVTVSFSPVQVNLATGELRWVSSADVTLGWAPETLAPATEPVEDPYWESIFAATLSNYEEARAWRESVENPEISSDSLSQEGGSQWVVTLEGTGLFGIPLSNLQGFSLGDVDRLAVYLGQDEQAVWVNGGNLYLINLQEPNRWSGKVNYRLELLPSGQTAKRMADLPSPPNQAATVTTAPFEVEFEQDRVYHPNYSEATPDEHWFWARTQVFSSTAPQPLSHWESTFDVVDLPAFVASANVEVVPVLAPIHNRCHYATVRFNESDSVSKGIADRRTCMSRTSPDRWNDTSGFNKTITVPGSSLRAAGNLVEVDIESYHPSLSGLDEIMVDGFAVRYQRALQRTGAERGIVFNSGQATGANFRVSGFDGQVYAFEISSPDTIRRITAQSGAGFYTFGRPASTIASERYLVTTLTQAQTVESIAQTPDSDLRADTSHADYLIIVPEEFRAAVQPLVQHNQSRGLVTRVATTQQIYNEFGEGVTDPVAIRAFIKHAYHTWQGTKLSFVLLVGDATYDPLNHLALTDAPQLWVPPMMTVIADYRTPPEYLEVPSDNSFVDAMNACQNDVPPYPSDSCEPATDPMPDIHIGRLPANSAGDVQAMVTKIVGYEATAPYQWQNHVLLVADDPDDGGNFHTLSDEVAALLPAGMDTTKAYHSGGDPLLIRDTIMREVNQGAAIINYIGHGEPRSWGGSMAFWTNARRDSTGQIASSDVAALENAGRLPLSLSWTCSDGYFIDPTGQGLGEDMARRADGGSIATFAPLTLDLASAHHYMTEGFYSALSNHEDQLDRPERQLGLLTDFAKAHLYAEGNPSYRRLLDSYVLFGDPALTLNIGDVQSVFLPLARK